MENKSSHKETWYYIPQDKYAWES